jgi:hypothetical protein
MQTEIKAQTVSERVRGEREQRPVAGRELVRANRRCDRRFSVPGARVRVPCKALQVSGAEVDLRSVLFGFLPSLVSTRREVVNLGMGGLAFESRAAVSAGVRVRMQLWVPGRAEPLTINGETRWCKRRTGCAYHVGVQFDRFSARSGMNAPEVLHALRDLEARHT